jgi:penicillin amidase
MPLSIPRPARIVGSALVLAVVTYGAARPIGAAPALGPLLEPAHGVWALARHSSAPRESSVHVPGLGGAVRVVYDERAVPHIFAEREEDAYRALGYVVARDRLVQLQMQTLAASGRLTEIAGARALDADREMRRLGLAWSAERRLAALDSGGEPARLVRAYADGVNAYIDAMDDGERPVELRLLGRRPARWRPLDSMLLLARMGWTLAYLPPELDRMAAASRVGWAAAALVPERQPLQDPIQPTAPEGFRAEPAHLAPPGAPDTLVTGIASVARELFPASLGARESAADERRTFASNNWAVAPSRSATGHALLAGDPHLELTLPSIWYEAHIVVPGRLDVHGVTIPGAPAIIIGVNRDLAWTFTNTGADVVDFWQETVDDARRPTRYLLDGAWRPIVERVERYGGRHGETIATDTVRFTHRGPMRRTGDGRWLSMRWTVLEPSGTSEIMGFLAMSRARTVREGLDAMAAHYRAPAQNMLVADRAGTIGIRSTGRFPIRAGDGSGMTVRDGRTTTSDWRGDLAVERWPQSIAPARGFASSANQQPVDPATVSGYWGGEYDPWRAMRINRLLRADSSVTVDEMRRWQTDPESERARWFLPHFVRGAERCAASACPGVDATRAREGARLLREWDGRYVRESERAILFELAMRELTARTWDELLTSDVAGTGQPRRAMTPPSAVLAALLADSASAWWDDRRTEDVESRDAILAASVAAALDSARARFGDPSSGGWKWGRVRTAAVRHLMQLPAFSALDIPVQGGPGTLNPSAGGAYGSSWRMVVELGPELRAWGTYPGGQSGNPASAHWRDRIPEWAEGRLAPLWSPRTAAEIPASRTTATLTLEPERR